MLTLNDGRSELWQWDTGRKLTVDAECSQVHFSNKVFGRSIDMPVIDGVVEIPDFILQTDKDLTAWAFVGTAENGYTKISKTFKVNRRNKPADYVFTPSDQTSLEEIKKEIEYLKSIQDPDAIKNSVEDYLEQNPVESPVQSVNGKIGKVELTAEDVGAISQDDLQEATNEALAQAKESGDFDGDDYVLTDDDKTEIAELAAGLVEVPEAPEISMQPLTFTGAVEATYDGSEAVNVEIPEGGGGEWKTLLNLTTTEEVSNITIDTDENGQTFDVKEVIIVCRIAANESKTAGPFCRFAFVDADGKSCKQVQTQMEFVPASGTADYRIHLEYIDSIRQWYKDPLWRSQTRNVYGTAYNLYTELNKETFDIMGSCVKMVLDARANMGVGSIIRIFGR